MKNLISLIVLIVSMNVFAQAPLTTDEGQTLAPINLPEETTVKSGDTKIIPLPRFTFIDRLSLEIKNSPLCGEDHLRVSFDGYQSQNVKVESGTNGYRTKIVIVNANARNIEVYNETGCKVKIKNIQVLPRRFGQHGHGHYYPATEAAGQVSFLMEAFLYLDALVGDADRVNYLSPAKKLVGKALATLQNSPETSQASLKAIQDVVKFLNDSQPFIDRLTSVETTFEIATEIQSVKVALERMIR